MHHTYLHHYCQCCTVLPISFLCTTWYAHACYVLEQFCSSRTVYRAEVTTKMNHRCKALYVIIWSQRFRLGGSNNTCRYKCIWIHDHSSFIPMPTIWQCLKANPKKEINLVERFWNRKYSMMNLRNSIHSR